MRRQRDEVLQAGGRGGFSREDGMPYPGLSCTANSLCRSTEIHRRQELMLRNGVGAEAFYIAKPC